MNCGLQEIDLSNYLVPILNVEAKVHVEVLVVIIVEDCVRLPRLPKVALERDARVVEDAVVVGVHQDEAERNCNLARRRGENIK